MIEQREIAYGTMCVAGQPGPRGPQGEQGPAGRDGVIQYTAGENITIENNVISATSEITAGVASFNGRRGVVMPATGDYTASMVGALPDSTVIPTKTSQLTNDSGFIGSSALASYRTSSAQDVIDATKANTADLAEVATSGDYNDLDNKPSIPLIPSNVSAFINDVPYLTQHQSLTGYATQQWVGQQNYASASDIPAVVNNVSSTSTTDALSANMGRDLQGQITNLSTLGRFLSLWNSTTGKPTTNPTVMPYSYKTGDYYIVSAVGTTNYKPDGTTYNNQASTTPETGSVGVSDMYYFDGQNWTLISKDLPTWSVDQTVISGSTNAVAGGAVFTELAGKQPTLTAGDSINISSNTISATSCPYTTTEPTSANTDGLKICYLQSEPTTKYSGWLYLIADN